MKYTLLFCAALCLSVFSHAQTEKYEKKTKVNGSSSAKFDSNVSIPHSQSKFDNPANKLKVSLLKDSLFVTDKDQPIPVRSIQALDSLMKKLPNPETLSIEFESMNGDREKIRAIKEVLKQCKCNITSKSMSVNKQK
jgi:hypothetical protein